MSNYNAKKYENSKINVPESFCKEQIMEFIKNKLPILSKNSVMLPMEDWCNDPESNVKVEKISCGILTPYHNHNFIEINYCANGCVVEYIDGKELFLNSKDFILMSNSAFHVSVPCANTVSYNILIRSRFYSGFTLQMQSRNPNDSLAKTRNGNFGYAVFRNNADNTDLDKIVNSLVINEHEKSVYANLNAENLLKLMLCRISEISQKKLITAQYETHESTCISDISDLIRYIDDNFSDLTLERLSRRFGYSKVQIHRIIKKQTGTTFCKYISSLRISRAAYLLTETSVPISHIAAAAGISSYEHFSRMFRSGTGLSPSDYRKKYGKYKQS